MKRTVVLLLSWALSFTALGRTELKPTKLVTLTSVHQLSGLATLGGDLLAVADDKEDLYVYKLVPQKSQLNLVPYIDLAKLSGFRPYLNHLASLKTLKKKHRRFDLEGIANCDDTFYLANERVREIVIIEDKKNLKVLPLSFLDLPDALSGGPNAGLEGVAVDCEKQRLYVAKEREPRRLYTIDLTTGLVIKAGDFEGSNRQGQRVIEPYKGESLITVGSDMADLYFADGHLYALERNTFEIAKLNPDTYEVLDRVSYYHLEHGLYETGEPFGTAEALLIQNQQIIVGFDNNGSKLTHAAQEKYGVAGPYGALVYFERPKGF